MATSSSAATLNHRMATASARTITPATQHQPQISFASSSADENTLAAAMATAVVVDATNNNSALYASTDAATTQSTGPTELYRLIATTPPQQEHWDVILNRAQSHPHEACFYAPNAGGHVYALHRLLRCCEDENDDDESGAEGGRPPVSVVEAVMQACPRAVTRKQAVIDEDDLMMLDDSNGVGGESNSMGWQARQQPHSNLLPNFPPVENNAMQDRPNNAAAHLDNNEEVNNQPQAYPENDNTGDLDEVRFEYPLAIACECEQDGEIVRLLSSYLSKTEHLVYRSEVFRSLDYASLPNHVVRILLEEYAGCVLERGTNSEDTEGDDDDCPLEQVLFWWDDPDMMGMEEDIMEYPNCGRREDLCDLWEKLRMMLYASTMGTMVGYDDSKESFQVLHHVLRIVSEGGIKEVRFPNDFAHAVLLLAKFIQREKGSMFEERDESGSLPLHIAVSGKRFLRPDDPRAENGRNGESEGEDEDDNGQHENNANREEAMDGFAQDLAGPVGFEAQEQNNGPVPPQEEQGGPAMAQLAEEDSDDEEDDEGDDNAVEDGNEASKMQSDMEIVRLLLDQYPASIRKRDSQSGSLPVHLALQHNPRAIEAIEHFLNLYPRSVTMPDGNGRLPLHLALIQESPIWDKVLSLSPTALEAREPVTGLLPFQLAAMAKPESKKDDDTKGAKDDDTKGEQDSEEQRELESLSTCFRLLRMSPCLASGLGKNIKPRRRSLIEQQVMVGYTPRVTKLEEENERLSRRVEELEHKLASMQMMSDAAESSSGSPYLKKRKSSSNFSIPLDKGPSPFSVGY